MRKYCVISSFLPLVELYRRVSEIQLSSDSFRFCPISAFCLFCSICYCIICYPRGRLSVSRFARSVFVFHCFCGVVFFGHVDMPSSQVRGNCGHLKSQIDLHSSCLSCSGCTPEQTCDTCAGWDEKRWKSLLGRVTYKERKSRSRNRSHSRANSGVSSPARRTTASAVVATCGDLASSPARLITSPLPTQPAELVSCSTNLSTPAIAAGIATGSSTGNGVPVFTTGSVGAHCTGPALNMVNVCSVGPTPSTSGFTGASGPTCSVGSGTPATSGPTITVKTGLPVAPGVVISTSGTGITGPAAASTGSTGFSPAVNPYAGFYAGIGGYPPAVAHGMPSQHTAESTGLPGSTMGPRFPHPGYPPHWYGVPPQDSGAQVHPIPYGTPAPPWLGYGQPWVFPHPFWPPHSSAQATVTTASASVSSQAHPAKASTRARSRSPVSEEAENSEGSVEDGEVLSVLAPSQDPILDESVSVAANNPAPVAKPSARPVASVVQRGSASDSEYEVEEEECIPSFSFERAVNEAFRYLPEQVCPRIETPLKSKFEGFIDATADPSDRSDTHFLLPMAPAVSQLVKALESAHPGQSDSSVLSKGLDFKWGSYKFSEESFPLKNPPLDDDSSRLGIKSPSSSQVSSKTVERWEQRARQLVGIASHNNAFVGALFHALKTPTPPSDASIQLLLEALNRTSRHAIGMSLSLATEILKQRREDTLAGTSSLSENSRRRLASAPISSPSLFGGLIGEISESERNDSLRQAALGAVAFKRPSPRPSHQKRGGGGGTEAKPANKRPRLSSPLQTVQPPPSKSFQKGQGKKKAKFVKRTPDPRHKP